MASLGVLAEELDHTSIPDIRAKLLARERRHDVPNEVIELRYNACEKKREERLAMVTKVSELVIHHVICSADNMILTLINFLPL